MSMTSQIQRTLLPPCVVVAFLIAGGAFAQGPGFLRAGNDYYTATIADLNVFGGIWIAGYPGAFTGPLHPMNSRMGGRAEILGTHWLCADCGGWNDYGLSSLRLYSEHADITLGNNPNYLTQPEAGFDCVAGDDLYMPVVEELAGPIPTVRATWLLTVGGATLRVRREMRVHGDDIIDSRIESSLYVQNLDTEELVIGIRDGFALRFSGPLSPSSPSRTTSARFAIGAHPPSPVLEPLEVLEAEWIAPPFRLWEATTSLNPSLDSGGYSTAGVIRPNGVLDPAPTPPTLLQYTTLNARGTSDPGGGAADNCFSWRVPNTGRTARDFYQMAMVSYWGHDEAHAITIAPGEEVRFTQYLVTFEDYPLSAAAGADMEVECDADASAALSGTATTISPTGSEIKTTWSSSTPGVTFDDPSLASTVAHFPGVGSYELTFTAAVGAFEASDSVVVDVIDTTPPRITALSAMPASLWPPDHRLHRITIAISAEDDCDAAALVRLLSATSNEPDEQQQAGGDGNTMGDIAEADIGMDDRSVLLRAERSGGRDGRVYTLTYEATDASGNAATASVTVSVAHDQGPPRIRPRRRP